MNSKLVNKLAPWCVALVVIGGCGSILYPMIQGSLEYKREVAPFHDVGGQVTASGGGDMGITAGRAGIASIRLPESVGDEELAGFAKRMKRFPNLRGLSLSGPKVTDAGLAHLVGLGQLQCLTLTRTAVTDAGLAHLARLSGMRTLTLAQTVVTDAGLLQLKNLTQLRELYLENSKVTAAGVSALKNALPNLRVAL